jgi:hypothetical protein
LRGKGKKLGQVICNNAMGWYMGAILRCTNQNDKVGKGGFTLWFLKKLMGL